MMASTTQLVKITLIMLSISNLTVRTNCSKYKAKWGQHILEIFYQANGKKGRNCFGMGVHANYILTPQKQNKKKQKNMKVSVDPVTHHILVRRGEGTGL